jgi:riboflavin synthase alpha subunit
VAGAERRSGGILRLSIDPLDWDHRPAPGESICVSGCCLTLAEPAAGSLVFDVIPETLRRTTLGGLGTGARVNLERSLAAGDLMGGHLVQGHVDGVGVVQRVTGGGDYRVTVRPPADLMPYIVPKGSIAIDGVSLTIAACDPAAGVFEVSLIPATLEKTTLGELAEGGRCNLETDAMAKTIVHYLRYYGGAPGE